VSAGLVETVADLRCADIELVCELGAWPDVASLIEDDVALGDLGELVVDIGWLLRAASIDPFEDLALFRRDG
jgi:hypothetical protein